MGRRNVVASLLIVALSAVLALSSTLVAQNEEVSDSGRPVVGRMVLPTDFKGHIDMAQGHGSLVVGIPPEDFPEGYDQMTSSQKRAFLKKWWSSSEAKEGERTRKPNSFNVLADGTFRVEDIEPGWYIMFLRIMELRTTVGAKHHVVLASARHKFEVPEMSTDRSSESLDVGTIELNVYRQLQVGEQAPDFCAKTADGESISLADYRGKYLLLNFWDTGGPNNIIMPLLRKVNARYADDPRFALVGLNTDQFTDVAIEYSKEKEFAGIQGYLGQRSKVQSDYGADETPSTFLIGLNGKIIARWIQDGGMLTDIEATLQYVLP
ncbi:MAG: peroxiredoxin family protein [Pirellulaceae bacterium]